MKNRMRIAAWCVAGLVALGDARVDGALTFLRTQGQDLIDENRTKVLLRGVGLGNWMLPEGYMWRFGNEGDRPRKIEKIVSDLIGPENASRFWTEFRAHYRSRHRPDCGVGLQFGASGSQCEAVAYGGRRGCLCRGGIPAAGQPRKLVSQARCLRDHRHARRAGRPDGGEHRRQRRRSAAVVYGPEEPGPTCQPMGEDCGPVQGRADGRGVRSAE